MGINKVIFGNTPLVDLSGITLSQASELANGITAIDRTGTLLTGTASGGSSYTLIASQEYTVNTTSTTATNLTPTIKLGSDYYTKDKIIYVRIRDKAGKRNGYFLGSDVWFANYYKANGATTTLQNASRMMYYVNTDGTFGIYPAATTTGYGVYAFSISSAGTLTIRSRYHATYSQTLNGTYLAEVYTLDWPGNTSVFA